MELLALTSKVLYDNELLEAKKELDKLRKTYETPRVMFETWHDWEKTKMNIGTELSLFMIEKNIGLSEAQRIDSETDEVAFVETEVMRDTGLEQKIEQILLRLTGNPDWSYGKADEIISGINDVISTIDRNADDTDIPPLIEKDIDTQRRIIHSIICKRLGLSLGKQNGTLLCMVPQFMCKRCNSIVDYVFPPAHICVKCMKIAFKISLITTLLAENPSRRLLLENSTIIDAPVGEQCAICHEQYLDNENIRKLTTCSHSFHSQCIENWFNEQYNCPICREVI